MKMLSLFSTVHGNKTTLQEHKLFLGEISSGYKRSVLHHEIGRQGNGTISLANSASHDPE